MTSLLETINQGCLKTEVSSKLHAHMKLLQIAQRKLVCTFIYCKTNDLRVQKGMVHRIILELLKTFLFFFFVFERKQEKNMEKNPGGQELIRLQSVS